LCPTLQPHDCSPPSSSVGFQAKILEWVAISFSRNVSCIVRQFTTSATWETQTLLSIYPEMELLDHMAILFLIFGGTAIPFSTVAVPSYILTNSVKGLQFLHILAIVFCFLDF